MKKKIIYNCDGIDKANVIFKDKEKNDVLLPPIKSFITIEKNKEKLGCSTAIGYINNHSNNVDYDDKFELIINNKKEIYNTDYKTPCSEWVKKEIKGLKTYDMPQLTSSIMVKTEGKTMRGAITSEGIGFFLNANNNIYENVGQVSIFTSPCSKGNGFSVIRENIFKVTSLFTARKTIQPNWINCKDEYLAPNENHPAWQQFQYDSLIYSLFNNSSQQSSLRQVEYKGKLWDIKNEFFWLK
jgi:hypothetical protein